MSTHRYHPLRDRGDARGRNAGGAIVRARAPKVDEKLIEKIISQAKEHNPHAGIMWWVISSRAAARLVRNRHALPRPGYDMRLPKSERHGRSGNWTLFNCAGKYELVFFYD